MIMNCVDKKLRRLSVRALFVALSALAARGATIQGGSVTTVSPSSFSILYRWHGWWMFPFPVLFGSFRKPAAVLACHSDHSVYRSREHWLRHDRPWSLNGIRPRLRNAWRWHIRICCHSGTFGDELDRTPSRRHRLLAVGLEQAAIKLIADESGR